MLDPWLLVRGVGMGWVQLPGDEGAAQRDELSCGCWTWPGCSHRGWGAGSCPAGGGAAPHRKPDLQRPAEGHGPAAHAGLCAVRRIS